MKEINVVILAAGKGTRMKSLNANCSKVGFKILGVPILRYVLDQVKTIKPSRIVTVVGFGKDTTIEIINNESLIVGQKEQLGTGHAVLQAEKILAKSDGVTLILCGDSPLIRAETLSDLLNKHINNNNKLTVVTAILDNPSNYGRIIKNELNNIDAIVEVKDANSEELKINEINAGIYAVDNSLLFKHLKRVTNNNVQKEIYLTDIVSLFNKANLKVGGYLLKDANEMLGINDRIQLSEAETILKARINHKHMLNGVSIIDPLTTYIGPEVSIEQDTTIGPNSVIFGKTTIGKNNKISENCHFEDVSIGDDNEIISSHIVGGIIGNNNHIGPFARIRGGSVIHNLTRIGNFVEFKNVEFCDGAKCAHLTYLGDARVGENTNIGCGVITANYDGFNKWRSEIGSDVFVGSNSVLVAPIKICDKAFIAAGSTITKSVGTNELAIARARQENLVGKAQLVREKAKKLKDKK